MSKNERKYSATTAKMAPSWIAMLNDLRNSVWGMSVEKLLCEYQVPRRGDRQELRETFYDTEYDAVEERHDL
jgi:hypothetical protein